ncbi:MAG: hypothetical protein JMDDDDMK_01548 [Acidobacteria bacterium]|nr:hypothetical protein [Acidobacteriota bacterium]
MMDNNDTATRVTAPYLVFIRIHLCDIDFYGTYRARIFPFNGCYDNCNDAVIAL